MSELSELSELDFRVTESRPPAATRRLVLKPPLSAGARRLSCQPVERSLGAEPADLARPQRARRSSGVHGVDTPRAPEATNSSRSADPEVFQAGERRSARVESLRALAALSVLTAHVWLYFKLFGPSAYAPFLHGVVAGGGLGVQLFFALSGYLIFRPFARRDFGPGGRIDLKTYALNRALRILPLYWVAIVALMIATQHGGSFTQWWRFGLFAESFWTSTAQTVDGPMWSVVVEIHFYILLPVIAWVLSRITRGNRAYAIALVLLAGLVSVGFRSLHPSPWLVWEFSLPATFYGFVPGMVLALLQIGWEERTPRFVRGLAGAADAWLVLGIGLWLVVCWEQTLAVEVIPFAAFLVVGAVVLAPGAGRLVAVLDIRPLALIGVVSYSIYIWHVPIISELVRVSALARSFPLLFVNALFSSLVAATASYFLVERPALRLRRAWAKPSGAGTRTAVAGTSARAPAAIAD